MPSCADVYSPMIELYWTAFEEKTHLDDDANDIETLTLSSLCCDFIDVADRVPS